MPKRDDDTGHAGFGRIARGLSDLFDFLSELDERQLPRRGKREKNGMVIEYSFGKRALGEAEPEPAAEARQNAADRARRGRGKPGVGEVSEPVTDIFDEADEIVLLFEVPGVARKDVRCTLDADILVLEAKSGERLYRKEVLIEAALAAPTPRLRLRNGVLEVRLAKR
jgi:HSP20 family protein